MRSRKTLLAIGLVVAGLSAGACNPGPQEGWASASVIGDLTDAIGGPKATAQAGDILLENDVIRLVILGERTSYAPGVYGGTLIDADLQRNDPRYAQGHGNDLLGEIIPMVNLNVVGVGTEELGGTVEIVSDGSNGGAAIVRVTGGAESFVSLLDGVWLLLGAPDFTLSQDYILQPGKPYVTLRTTATYGGGTETDGTLVAPIDDSISILDYALETGMAAGDFYLSGGNLDDFLPGYGFDEHGVVIEAEEAGRNTFDEPFLMDFIASTGEGVSYGLAAANGPAAVPMFTSSQTVVIGGGAAGDGSGDRFEDGTAWTYERYVSVGEGDVGSVLDGLLAAFSDPNGPTFGTTGLAGIVPGTVEGHVVEDVTGLPLSDISVLVYQRGEEKPWSMWTTDVGSDVRADGSFGGTLPPGDYTAIAHALKRPDSMPIDFTVTPTGSTDLLLTLPMQGQVSLTVTDEEGRIVPAKVTFFSEDTAAPRDFDMGDGYISADIVDVVFLAHGTGDVALAPGAYTAVASRGIEYELHEIGPFDIDARDHLSLQFQVLRTVDTTGYVAADFHVHSISSTDSGVTHSDRVATMVAEGMEFFTSNDHDIITDYRPTIEAMALESWVGSAPGVEVSSVEVGHYLGFPLEIDHLAPGKGAPDWVGLTPTQIFDEIRSMGVPGENDPVTIVAHPRDGILGYFDQYGLNPYVASNGELTFNFSTTSIFNTLLASANFTLDFDALEILNGKRFEIIRTPTQEESDAFASAAKSGESAEGKSYAILERTMDEQLALIDSANGGDTFNLAYGVEGQIDDWFALLNLGYRHTALANSDTHSKSTVEAGCPRNYVASATDDPGYIDVDDLTDTVRAHDVILTYGPFLRFEINGEGVGSELTTNGSVEAFIEVQSPSWFNVDRVELYENGTVIETWTIESPNADTVNLSTTTALTPTQDSWYVLIALGNDDLSPMFTPVERPHIQLQDLVVQALSPIDTLASSLPASIPQPRTFPTFPYGLTNPIWVDVGGDGWTAPGLPAWLQEPPEPEEEDAEPPKKGTDTGLGDTGD